jgi:hypothetical protein
MATANKVTSANHLPGEGNDRFPVYSKQFNALVDVVNELEPADGTLVADTIQESTSAAGVTVDGVLIKDGSLTHSSLASMQMGWFNVAAQQAITSNGAIATTSYYTTMNTTGGAKAYTLANASLKGQLKKIYFLTDGGDAVITGTFPGVNNTLTFANAGEYVVLIWTGTSWYPIEGSGGVYSQV